MKNYSRILALVLALLLVLTGAAFAEAAPDSTAYTMTIYDPVVYMNDEPMLDLTGLTLDLSAAATDTGLLGIFADVFAGENFEYITSLTAQLDPTGVTGYVDGMSNTYNVNVAALAGVNPYDLLAGVPLRTTLNSLDASVLEEIEFTPEMRIAMVKGLVGSFSGVPTDNVYPISITEEQSAELVAALADMIEQAKLDEQVGDLRDIELTFTLEGTMTVEENAMKIDAKGDVIQAGSSVPYTLTYTDDMQTVDLDFVVLEEDGSAAGGLFADSKATVAEDGRTSVETTVVFNADDEDMITATYTAEPASESAQMDYKLNVVVPEEGMSMDFVLSTGIYEDGNGFYSGVIVNEGEEAYGFTVEYAGEYVEDAEMPYHSGGFYGSVITPDGVYSLEIGLMLSAQDADSAVWALPTEGAVSLLTMTEEQQDAAMNELMTVGMNALPVLQANIPGIASFLGLAG